MSEGQPPPQALRFSQGTEVMNRKGPFKLMHMHGQVSKDLATFSPPVVVVFVLFDKTDD